MLWLLKSSLERICIYKVARTNWKCEYAFAFLSLQHYILVVWIVHVLNAFSSYPISMEAKGLPISLQFQAHFCTCSSATSYAFITGNLWIQFKGVVWVANENFQAEVYCIREKYEISRDFNSK